MKGEHFHECSQRIEDRGISELIGIARGLVADGVVNELEADFLLSPKLVETDSTSLHSSGICCTFLIPFHW